MRNTFGLVLTCCFLVFPALLADRPARADDNKGKDCSCADCVPVCTYTYTECTYEAGGKCYVWHSGWGVMINGTQYPVTRKTGAVAALGTIVGSRIATINSASVSVGSGHVAASQFSFKGTPGAQSVQSPAAVVGAIDGSTRRGHSKMSGHGKRISIVKGETPNAAKGVVASSQALIARTPGAEAGVRMPTIGGATLNATSAAVVSPGSAVLSATTMRWGAGSFAGSAIGPRPR
jgi:hypothetical protein